MVVSMDGIDSVPVPNLIEKKNHFYPVLWFVIAFLIFGDFITTWYGVEYLGFTEQNPFMSVVVDNKAWQLLALFKVEEFTFIYALVSYMSKFNDKSSYLIKMLFVTFSLIILIVTLAGNICYILGLC